MANRVKSLFVIFDIRALWRSYGNSRCQRVNTYSFRKCVCVEFGFAENMQRGTADFQRLIWNLSATSAVIFSACRQQDADKFSTDEHAYFRLVFDATLNDVEMESGVGQQIGD